MGRKREESWENFKVPKRKKPVFNLFGKIIRPFFKAETQSTIENLPDKAIIVSIHAAKKGPMAISLNYPKYHAMWGHHAMLGSYADRFKYLRNVLYIQKMHKNKFIATLKATYEAFFSIFIYKGMRMLGTYTDMRFLGTVRKSMKYLDAGASVIIYPEDSAEGYFDEVRAAFPGFVMLSSTYYQKTGEDVPVIPAYISTKKKRFIIGAPRYVHELEASGLTKQQIADVLKDDINALYRKYIVTDAPVEATIKDAEVRTKEYYGE